MESINDTIIFLSKKGVRDTFQVLTQFENYNTERNAFYNELKKFSYYQSFYRVKEALIKKGIITIKKSKKKESIALTQKGIKVYNKLIKVNELISN